VLYGGRASCARPIPSHSRYATWIWLFALAGKRRFLATSPMQRDRGYARDKHQGGSEHVDPRVAPLRTRCPGEAWRVRRRWGGGHLVLRVAHRGEPFRSRSSIEVGTGTVVRRRNPPPVRSM
jgi:hypothetical protein